MATSQNNPHAFAGSSVANAVGIGQHADDTAQAAIVPYSLGPAMHTRVLAVPVAALLVLASPGQAAEEGGSTPDKSAYTLFNPVPDDQLRELNTDRPGKSHSAITVDPGRVQIESDFVTYTYDPRGRGATTTRAYSLGTPIVKLGVTDWLDLELGLALFNSLRQSGGGNSTGSGASASAGDGVTGGAQDGPARARGFGDTLLGAKVNLFGNDGGDQSLALLPFLKLPTAARGLGNDHVEFTINAPYTIALSKPWSLTLEPNFGVVRNADNTRYRENYGFIANLSRPVLIEGLTAAVEVAVDVSSERKERTRVSFDPSLQYLVTKNLQLDVGVYLGLNKATPRYVPYLGISYRF